MFEAILNAVSDWIILIILILDLFCLLFLLLAERTDPNKFIVWALIFIILPIIGFIIYLFIGQTFYADHEFKVKGLKDQEMKIFEEADKEYIKSFMANEIAKPDNEDKLQVIRSIKATTGPSFTNNNEVKLFTLGQEKFDSLFEDLRNAKNYIHMEYYIIRDDELGNELMEILTQKVKEGVKVRLLSDYVGIGKGPHKAIKAFKNAGGKFESFHDMKSTLLSPKKNNRNHRKIAVIDGVISYCGGFNVGDEYLGKGPLGYWRDSAVRIRGAATVYLNGRFFMDWEYASKEEINAHNPIYTPEASYNVDYGDTGIQIVSGGPDCAYYNPIRLQYLEMFNSAKKTIWFHTPYLIPNDSVVDSLKIAAGKGVDVRIIIPDKPDHLFVFWNNIYNANRLMEAGIKVYMYNRGFVHSKTVVVDGKYCSVGSANMDDRSLVLNFETNAMIYSEELGSQMMAAFEEDLKYCTQYTCEEYQKHGTWVSLKIGVSKLFKNLA